MFFMLFTVSLILSITGGVLLSKNEQVIGFTLLALGLILFFLTTIFYRSKKGKKTDCFPDCDFFDCDGGGLDCKGPDCT
ncbi:hypothetical protein SAMN05877753_11018 [Bacillus oleivorans]|uniref:Uncharacterized protein n=1 Tax=Bacillus oleivorans TaxID=1448271 RepID=A0A285D4F5_9BACI|nr:hypothetical protein SAMN05877753_11018 [Bacillus oleivorans]